MGTPIAVHACVGHLQCCPTPLGIRSCRPNAYSKSSSLHRGLSSSCRKPLSPIHCLPSANSRVSQSKACLSVSSARQCSSSNSTGKSDSSSICSQQIEERQHSSRNCSTSYLHEPISQKAQHSSRSRCSSTGPRDTCSNPQRPLQFAAAEAAGNRCSPGSPASLLLGFATPPAPCWPSGAGLPMPRSCSSNSNSTFHRRRRGASVRTAAFAAGAAGAAGAASSTPWHQAIGLSLRGVLWGIALTLGTQLLLALLLRTIWAQRAIAALESWLQAVFGVSLRSGRASYSAEGSMEEEDSEAASAIDSATAAAGMSRSSSSSSSSSSGSGSSSSSDIKGAKGKKARAAERAAMAALVHNAPGESVEWVNMCFRKIWRVYQRGLERWITDLLQPVFDGLIQPGTLPTWLLRLRIVELTLDHEAPYFSNMRRRNSRKDSDLTGVVDLRYTGGARLLLMLELGQGRWRFKIPVLVSDLDVQCALWLKLRLAPMCPWIGTISLAFVGPPAVKVQLSPYNRVRLMRIPVLQNLLNRLLTVDLPGLMVLPERLEISVPPSVTSIAEAAVGRDTIMRAVASAVLQVDSLEQALLAALPLGPQAAAGGVSLPELFRGELTVTLREGRDLPVWGMPWQSNPWVRLVMGEQAVASRRDSETSTASRHGAPVWNQEVQFLVEDPDKQVLEVYVNDSHLTGRPKVGKAVLALKDLPADGRLSVWLPLEPVNAGQAKQGEVLLDITFKAFEDDEQDSGYREAQEYARAVQQQSEAITDIRSAAAASSRAAVAASAAISAIAMTKAAAARAAARAAQAAKDAGTAALNTAAAVTHQQLPQQQPGAGETASAAEQPLMLPPPGESTASMRRQKQQQLAARAAQKGDGKDKDDSGGPTGGNGTTAAAAAAGEVLDEEAAAAAAAAKRREEALIEALEARMAFRVRSTSGTPKPGAAAGNGAAAAAGAVDGNGAAAAGATGGASADATVTLPADSLMSDSSGDEDEAAAVERAQRAVVDILEKSKRMEAAVNELAALTAGSPTEAALQQGAIKAAADAVAALSAFQSTDAPPSSIASSSSSSSSASVASSSTAVAEREVVQVGSGDGGSSSSGSSSNGSSKGYSSYASGYSIWGEEQQADKHKHKQQQKRQEDLASEQQQQVHGLASDIYDVSEAQQQLEQQHLLLQQLPPQPEQPPLPSVVVRVKDGQHILSEVVGGAGHDKAVQTDSNPLLEKAVQAGMTDLGPAAAVTRAAAEAAAAGSSTGSSKQQEEEDKPWWSSVVFWLPGQKGAEAGGSGSSGSQARGGSSSSSSSSQAALGPESPEPDTAMIAPDPISTAQRAWWGPLIDNDFVRSLPGMRQGEQQQRQQDGSSSSAAAEQQQQQQQDDEGGSDQQGKKKRHWWEDLPFLPKSDEADGSSSAAAAAAADDGVNKPVEAIVIPADLPLEEIAKEVAKLKEDAWKSKEDHLESLWAKTVERNDRSWLMLVCFLLTVAIGLLAVVAYRIAVLEGGDATAVADAAGMVVGQLPVMLLAMAAAALSQWGGGSSL